MPARCLRWWCLAALFIPVAAAGDQTGPDPVRAILDEASAAPVEVFADIAFNLIEGKRLSPEAKKTLLQDVFDRAGAAKEPLPLRYAGPQPISALTGTKVEAHGLMLDALSIRCRAVRAMLDLDPKRARQLFERIPAVEVPRTDCDSSFVPDAGIYVETLAAVVKRGEFTAEERKKQVPFWMLESGARRVGSSWELVAAMKVLPSQVRSDSEAKMLATSLTAALAITDSDRAFSSALWNGNLIPVVLQANTRLRREGSSDLPMLAALRQLLIRHLSGARCKDTAFGLLDGVEKFNAAVRDRADVTGLTAEEMNPARIDGKALRREPDNTPDFQERLKEVQKLGQVNQGESFSKVRLTPEWAFQAAQTLARIQDWKEAPGQDPVELFHQKGLLLWQLYGLAPAGRTSDTVLSELIRVLEDESILKRSPAEWIAELRRLQFYQRTFTPEAMQALRSSNVRIEGLPYESGLEISEALGSSRLSALSLYGRIALLNRKPKPAN